MLYIPKNKLSCLFLVCLLLTGCRHDSEPKIGSENVVKEALPSPELAADEFKPRYREMLFSAELQEDINRPKYLFVTGAKEKQFAFANLAHVSSIESLSLQDLELNSKELDLLSRLPNLKEVCFDSCRLPEDLDWNELSGIQELDFGEQRLTGELLVSITSAPDVHTISLKKCKIDSIVPLKEMSSLRKICFDSPSQIDQPESLYSLQQLTDLEFDSASIAGFQIPDFARLKNLQGLELVGNSNSRRTFGKAELESLSQLNNLERLSISGKIESDGAFLKELPIGLKEFRFTGTIAPEYQTELSRFHELQVLVLYDDSFRANAIKKIADNCPKIRTLDFRYVHVDASTMEAIGRLKQLESLVIHTDSPYTGSPRPKLQHESGILTGLKGLSNLELFDIFGRFSLDDQDATAIGSWKNLRELSIQSANLAPDVFREVGNLKKLEKVNLHSCSRVNSEHIKAIAKLSNLEELNLTSVRGRNFGLHALGALRNLRVLNLAGVTTLSNKDLGFASGAERLEELTIGPSGRIDDEGLALLGQAPRLRRLTLHKQSVMGAGFAEWPKDHPLQYLESHGIYFSQAGLEELAKLEHLETLSSRALLVGQSPKINDVSCFESSKSLLELKLQGTYVINKQSYDSLRAARPDLDLSFHHFYGE